jgi:hypothetical protein
LVWLGLGVRVGFGVSVGLGVSPGFNVSLGDAAGVVPGLAEPPPPALGEAAGVPLAVAGLGLGVPPS